MGELWNLFRFINPGLLGSLPDSTLPSSKLDAFADIVEERILKLHAKKRDLADALLEGTDDTSRLSYADMLALVQVP